MDESNVFGALKYVALVDILVYLYKSFIQNQQGMCICED